jgi:hypothetical protein
MSATSTLILLWLPLKTVICIIFLLNIFLTIKFCLIVLCSDTAPEIVPDWKEVFNVDEEPNKDVFCGMGEQNFSLYLLHFTWYAIAGKGSARNFSVAAYHTSLHQPNEDFKVRVYFIPISQNSSVAQQVRYILFS